MIVMRDHEATRRHRLQQAAAALAVLASLVAAAVAWSSPARPVPCAVLDLGDVIVCAQHVAGVEPDGFGGAVLLTALQGVRLEIATDLDVETVARRLRETR